MDFKFLDVTIGAIFTFLLLSIFASTIMELIATIMSFRAVTLEKAIKRMLDDGGMAAISKEFYNSSAIKYLGDSKNGKDKKPSYLVANNFSKAVIDIIVGKSDGKTLSVADIKNGLDKLKADYPGSKTSVEYMEGLMRDAGDDFEKFKGGIEQWFNDTMDRANGWYKRKTQWWLLGLGFLIAVAFNADTIRIIKTLNDNPQQRTELVDRAKVYIQKHDSEVKQGDSVSKTDNSALNKATVLLDSADHQQKEILSTGVIGWHNGVCAGIGSYFHKDKWQGIFSKIFGLLLTAFAVSLGSNFWFDLLKKIMNVRGAGVNPDEKNTGQATN